MCSTVHSCLLHCPKSLLGATFCPTYLYLATTPHHHWISLDEGYLCRSFRNSIMYAGIIQDLIFSPFQILHVTHYRLGK